MDLIFALFDTVIQSNPEYGSKNDSCALELEKKQLWTQRSLSNIDNTVD